MAAWRDLPTYMVGAPDGGHAEALAHHAGHAWYVGGADILLFLHGRLGHVACNSGFVLGFETSTPHFPDDTCDAISCRQGYLHPRGGLYTGGRARIRRGSLETSSMSLSSYASFAAGDHSARCFGHLQHTLTHYSVPCLPIFSSTMVREDGGGAGLTREGI